MKCERAEGAWGDREKARSLLDEAQERYLQIGMPRHIKMIQALLR